LYEDEIWFVDVSQGLKRQKMFDFLDFWLPYSWQWEQSIGKLLTEFNFPIKFSYQKFTDPFHAFPIVDITYLLHKLCKICLFLTNVLLMADHTSRYMNAKVCTCRGKVLLFVIICKTHRAMDLLWFPWQIQCAQCLQNPGAPSIRLFVLLESKSLVACLFLSIDNHCLGKQIFHEIVIVNEVIGTNQMIKMTTTIWPHHGAIQCSIRSQIKHVHMKREMIVL